MRLRWLGVLLSLMLSFAGQAATQADDNPSPDQAGIERLAGLCKLWGAVKFFHPFLAYQDIDWDGALVAAIPKVRAAKNTAEYRAAIQEFLSVLKDPATFALPEDQKPPLLNGEVSPAGAAPSTHFRNIGKSIVIDGPAMVELAMRGDAGESARVASALKEEMARAKGIIFDLRFRRPLSASSEAWARSFYLKNFLKSQLPDLIAQPLALGTARYRQHYGYVPRNGITSGGYNSSFVTVTPERLPGRRSGSAEPLSLAFLTNASTPDVSDLLSGFQAAQLATIIEETGGATNLENYEDVSVPVELAGRIKVYVRVRELLAPDGRTSFMPDIRVPVAANGSDVALEAALKSLVAGRTKPTGGERNAPAAALSAPYDKAYPDMTFPNAEYRLLALFRLWTVTNYFFPYKHLMDLDWEAVLTEFIPKFEASKSALDYQLTVMQLATKLQDSHVWVRNAKVAEDHIGAYVPPLFLASVEGRPVVVALPETADPAGGIGIGDEIFAIDGQPVEQRRLWLQSLIAASTPQALRRDVERELLRGARDSVAKLRIRDASGTERDIEVKRNFDWGSKVRWLPTYRKVPKTYELLPSGAAYIDLERLAPGEVDAAMAIAQQAPAIIFDLRGYPQGTGFTIAPRLVKKKSNKPVIGALFSPPFLRGDLFGDEGAAPKYTFSQPLQPTDKPAYQGKVVVLINEWAQSQAEHTCLAFAAATDVTFIGSATAGANGDITNLILPGNLTVWFTGQEVRYADGRQLQRIGVQPNIHVTPTIAGIRAKRDEVLEAAVSFLQQQARP